ncbi:unnamed protein product [Penicillium salamii]|uniref:Nuclear RNA binding protein n=1 Tax=Penicillium salamii TaxID=1612424 RepID=A0A9W4JQK7_9EURO|nr:unnamed protein product [Penicillium salamii]CAG8096337.1 unnamed protein product [Penicillium salamii]CAG8100629.1 unnamed protein product [Penicillium salamii]CAG8167513.1 unnamed protein product [Penicillium salamii]CAG8225823.1 unnamed protein product [Penicillium salamii]
MNVDRSPALRTSRKHLRSSDDGNSYDWSSDSSGQFDDAEEVEPEDYRSPAGNLAKRRRSNDWPLPEEAADYGANDRRNQRSETGHLSVGSIGTPSRVSPRASPRASPRGSLASLRARHAAASSSSPRHLRGRTSRFVEATMSDSVSEKPPSIYFRDRESKPHGNPHRSSGIFRFGKAIASAFNPFGGWNKSEGSPTKSPQKDVINQAEQAYAELKKAGYKGTNKGHYIQTHGVDCVSADRTWQSIQDKTEHSSPVKDSRRYSIDRGDRGVHSRSDSGASKRSSLQDLRLPMSFFHKSHESPSASQATIYCDRTSEESETGLRKQPSRKELSRQTKLLKKVSNLEDKLDRARRELRELTGNEPPPLPALAPIPQPNVINTINTEIDPASFPRKFVPGALPTLPSERLLNQQAAETEASGSNGGDFTALPSMDDRESFSFEEIRPAPSPAAAKQTRRRSKETWPSPLGKDSLSRKRKSPIPEPVDSRKPPQPCSTDCVDDLEQDPEFEDLIDFGLLSPPGRAKWQKSGAGESPGSAKRRQATNQSVPAEPDAKPTEESANAPTRRSPYVSSPQKPSAAAYSPSPKPTTPRGTLLRRSDSNRCLKSSPPFVSEDPVDMWSSPVAPQDKSHSDFYLHSQTHLDPDRSPRTPSRSKTSPSRSTRYRRDEDIPPVPPLPEELRSSAAKVHVNKSFNKSPKKRPVSAPVFTPTSALTDTVMPDVEDYQWPDDIF